MSVRELFIIRHGETDYNKSKIVQGEGVDAPLNDLGRQQAEAFFQHYRHLAFDKIITSRLKRAYQTVEPFYSEEVPIKQHKGLNEINWGYYEGKAVAQEQREYYQSLLQSWRQGFTHIPIYGGESPEDVAEKQEPVLRKLLYSNNDKRTLVCMHGRAMRVFLCQLLGKPLKEMDQFQHGNLSLYHLCFDDHTPPQLLKTNCKRHLIEANPQTSIHA